MSQYRENDNHNNAYGILEATNFGFDVFFFNLTSYISDNYL